jgi:hypothetical protein
MSRKMIVISLAKSTFNKVDYFAAGLAICCRVTEEKMKRFFQSGIQRRGFALTETRRVAYNHAEPPVAQWHLTLPYLYRALL